MPAGNKKTPALTGASVSARGSTQVSCWCAAISWRRITVSAVYPTAGFFIRVQASTRRWFSLILALRNSHPYIPVSVGREISYSSWSKRLEHYYSHSNNTIQGPFRMLSTVGPDARFRQPGYRNPRAGCVDWCWRHARHTCPSAWYTKALPLHFRANGSAVLC